MSLSTHITVLASMFFKEIKEFKTDSFGKIQCELRYKAEVLHDIGELLAGKSMPAKEMQDLFEKEKENPDKTLYYKPSNLLEAHGVKITRAPYREPDNLLTPGAFYLHPRLQVVPPPPVIDISDDGIFKASYEEEPFFLEMVDKLTLQDVVNYFYFRLGKPCPDGLQNREAGAVEHLLKFYSIDLILYMIDEAFACSIDYGRSMPKSVIEIQDFYDEAKLVYENRKNNCFEEGIDRVHARPIT